MYLITAANDDFEAPNPPTIVFPPGSALSSQMCVSYQIINDVFKEYDEMFTIIVAPEHNFDIIEGPSEISVTIRDDMDCESQTWIYSAIRYIVM